MIGNSVSRFFNPPGVVMPKYSEKMREMIGETVRSDIHRAGIELIREQGWKAFTTEKIAEKLGMSRGVLYNYFANKEAIARSIVEASFDELSARLEEIASGPQSASDRLRAMAEWNVSSALNQREFLRAFMENLPPPNKPRPHMAEHHRRRDAVFAAVIADGVASGEFAGIDIPAAVLMLSGILHESCIRSLFRGETPQIDRVMTLFLRGIAP